MAVAAPAKVAPTPGGVAIPAVLGAPVADGRSKGDARRRAAELACWLSASAARASGRKEDADESAFAEATCGASVTSGVVVLGRVLVVGEHREPGTLGVH